MGVRAEVEMATDGKEPRRSKGRRRTVAAQGVRRDGKLCWGRSELQRPTTQGLSALDRQERSAVAKEGEASDGPRRCGMADCLPYIWTGRVRL